MRRSEGKLCFSEKGRGNVWKDYIGRIMNEENNWCCNVEGDIVEGPVVCVTRGMFQALNENRKSHWIFKRITRVGCY